MNSQEFVIWLKGFTEGVHEFNITPKQWDLLKEKLSQVSDAKTPIGVGGYGTTSGYFSASYIDHGTSTARYPQPNATITYTTNGAPNWYSTNIIENDSREK